MTVPGIDISFCWDFEEVSPAEGLARLRDHGFEGIELWPRWLDAFGISAWQQALSQQNMRCFQICPYFDFVHGAEAFEKSQAHLKQYLAYAALLNCQRLRVFTGPVPPHPGAVGSLAATDDQWDSAIVGLSLFCDIAAEQNIELCLECHEGMLMESSQGALRLLNGVHRPNLTTNLQIPLMGEDWHTSLDRLGPYTSHMHIHNWSGPMDMEHLTYLSAGDFDWQPVLEQLVRKYKRRVCLSIEHPRHGRNDSSWETARRDGPYLRQLKDSVRA